MMANNKIHDKHRINLLNLNNDILYKSPITLVGVGLLYWR